MRAMLVFLFEVIVIVIEAIVIYAVLRENLDKQEKRAYVLCAVIMANLITFMLGIILQK